jgi:hypothetical protein
MTSILSDAVERNGRWWTLIVWGLYLASFLLGFTWIVGLVIAYVKRDEMKGTLGEGHMTYAIRTAWQALGWGARPNLGFARLPDHHHVGVAPVLVLRPQSCWPDKGPRERIRRPAGGSVVLKQEIKSVARPLTLTLSPEGRGICLSA